MESRFKVNGIYYDPRGSLFNLNSEVLYRVLENNVAMSGVLGMRVEVLESNVYKNSGWFKYEKCTNDKYICDYTRLHEIVYGK
jgi:hypothetical protein